MITPLHVATIGGHPLRFFRTPINDGKPDMPWHAVDDLHQCLGLNRAARRFFLRKLQTGPWSKCVRTVATADGLVTVAAHFIAQGTISAMTGLGMSAATVDALESDYARVGTAAMQKLKPAHLEGDPEGDAFLAWLGAAFHRWDDAGRPLPRSVAARGREGAMSREEAMGMQRNAEIAEWQRKTGLKPSEQQELLRQMSDTAFALIKVIELERSGIRDGDGSWSGSDPMGGIARDLASFIEEYERRMTARDAEPSDRRHNTAGEDPMTDEERTEFLRIRKEAGLKIDPETAEVAWDYRQVVDPYGIYPPHPESDCVGRAYFARAPGSDIWVEFGDLPDPIRDALRVRHQRR
jgi:hypothetical protein